MAGVDSAAARRRRLRQFLRHERLSVAVALAESQHHSSRGQKTASAGEEARVALHGQVLEAPLTQGRVLRHVVGHLSVPALVVPVPQMVDQLPDIEQFFRVLSRSCLSMSLCARPCALRSWWNSWWKCRQSYPIPRHSGLWSTTSIFQFLVVEDQILVFKVFPLDRVQQRRLPPRNAFLSGLWSRSLTLFQVDVFMVLSQHKVHLLLTLQLVLNNALMSLVKGFFRTFPQNKKSAKVASHSGSELLSESSPSTPAAQQEGSVEWVRLRERHAGKTYFWNRPTNSTVWQAPAGVEVVWYGERDEEGGIWYWHRDTRVSTFDLPPLPPG